MKKKKHQQNPERKREYQKNKYEKKPEQQKAKPGTIIRRKQKHQ